MMRIPYANRTADVVCRTADVGLPGQPKVTVKAVTDDFRAKLPSNFTDFFEAFVLLSPRKVRVTCRTPFKLEEVGLLGLTFHQSPVTIRPCRAAKWVNITRLSYGVPNEALETVLSPSGDNGPVQGGIRWRSPCSHGGSDSHSLYFEGCGALV